MKRKELRGLSKKEIRKMKELYPGKFIEFLDLEKWVEFSDEYFMPILVFLEVFCFILWLIES
ncbi:MAG: hypothetical protein E6860_15920 [Clostridium sp.]|uniref:hypothetical protein n=1 Tax=Clostridium sp. TaxID=1506 RepID=UPI002902285D|nr:hypothetical protein [Clostridium sp.]MDU1587023.1 hypothetical protein [Clostridium sp.]